MEDGRSLEIRDHLAIFWRRRWLLAAAVAVAAASALLISSQATPVYDATAKIFVGPRTVERTDVSAALEELNFSGEFLTSYAELLSSRTMAERVVESEKLRLAPTELTDRITARVVPETRIIEVAVEDTNPARAQRIANALVDVFVSDVQRDFGGRAGAEASVLERALRPQSPVRPRPRREGVLGGFLGLLVGSGAALLLEQMNTRIRTREDLEAVLPGVSVLAVTPKAPDNGNSGRLAVERDPRSAEAFRMLRVNIGFMGIDRPARVLLVTSAVPQEGKTFVAMDLAATAAAAGMRTLLLESDLRRPTVHEHLDIVRTPGVTDLLMAPRNLASALQQTRIRDLSCLPAGTQAPNPGEIVSSAGMESLLVSARARAELIVLDSPPLLAVADAAVLAARVDGVLLVVRAGFSRAQQVRHALEALERTGARLLGVIFNGAERAVSYTDYYAYYAAAKMEPSVPANVRTFSSDLQAALGGSSDSQPAEAPARPAAPPAPPAAPPVTRNGPPAAPAARPQPAAAGPGPEVPTPRQDAGTKWPLIVDRRLAGSSMVEENDLAPEEPARRTPEPARDPEA